MRYFIASRWRNKEGVTKLTQKLRAKGATVFNFFEKPNNIMSGENPDAEMGEFEAMKDWRYDPRVKAIFDSDIDLIKQADVFALLLPAGNSAHIEAGIAYGLGKKLVVIGEIEKPETHYLVFDKSYPTIDEFVATI